MNATSFDSTEATQRLAEHLMDSALRDTLRERRVADLPTGEGR